MDYVLILLNNSLEETEIYDKRILPTINLCVDVIYASSVVQREKTQRRRIVL